MGAGERPCVRSLLTAAISAISASDVAATNDAALPWLGWLPWLVLVAIALLVAGIALRMIIAAQFPKGYGAWARSRRDNFAKNTAQWDRDDESRS